MQENVFRNETVAADGAVEWASLGSGSALLDLVSDRVFAFDGDLRVVGSNAAFNASFGGGDGGLVLGRSIGDVLSCRSVAGGSCGGSEACRLCGWYVAASGLRHGAGTVQECRILTRAGDAYDFSVRVAPAARSGVGLCALRDLRANKRLRVLERSFFHDVINLAIGVRGLAEMFDFDDPDLTREYVQLIHESAEKMVDTILFLRTLRSAESGDLATCYGSVSAAELVEAVLARHREAASARHLNVAVEMPGESSFETDRELLQLVLGALVLNAIEASSGGNRLAVGYALEEGAIVFFVRNEQVLATDVRLQLFERSYSTKGAGKGVGAYGAKLIAERYLGGQVWFVSQEPEGTTFYVRLPVASGE